MAKLDPFGNSDLDQHGSRSTLPAASASVATRLAPIVGDMLGSAAALLHVTCWDGSSFGDAGSPVRLRVNTPTALKRLVWAPGELGLSRAYVAGEIDLEGSVFDLLGIRDAIADPSEHVRVGFGPAGFARLLVSAVGLGAVGVPPKPPPEEASVRGRLHSRPRDRAAITHHYDVGNDFYGVLLGPTLTYSCAYFARPEMTLDEAQDAKHELICAKLGLAPGMRLLDVGCGFGGMALHAAIHHGVEAVGVTVSPAQHALATERVAAAGLEDRVEIRLADYRDIDDGPYDAVSSIGMFEHVGLNRMGEYFARIRHLLRPGGRFLNHAISRPGKVSEIDRRSFLARYVFPDGELHEVGSVASAMARESFEVRDVESLREHYARTTRAWVANLEKDWDRAVSIVGAARARIWQLYLAGSALGFEGNRIGVHQVLAVKTGPDGASGMPPSRESWAVPSTFSAVM